MSRHIRQPSLRSTGLRRLRLAMTLGLWTTVGLTFWSLPREAFPPMWIAAFTLPGCLFLLLGEIPLRNGSSYRMPMLWRIALCVLFQVSAAYVAAEWSGRLEHAAALACTLLPPTTYVALRRQDSDTTLALFLSFCLQLVGIMLARSGFSITTACWLMAAVWTLHLDTRLSTLGTRHQHLEPSPSARTEQRMLPWLLAIGCGIIALGSFRLLSLLPDLDSDPRPGAVASGARNPNRSQVGLSNSFDLGSGAQGNELSLRGDQLVSLRSLDGPARDNLYLRTAAFQQPELGSWTTGKIELAPLSTKGTVRKALPGHRSYHVEFERLSTQKGTVYTPPGTTRVLSDDPLTFAVDANIVQQPEPRGTLRYSVEYQDLQQAARQRPVLRQDPTLLALPESVQTSLFRDLMNQAIQNRSNDGVYATADAVAALLSERCVYQRREPVGPYSAPLLNFLHGERHGYCMHFASAAAMLLRMAGIPCRIAVGLYGGQPGQEQDVRNYGSQHGHAWVELPMEGMGWVVFDPTPPSYRASGSLPALEDALGVGDVANNQAQGGPSFWSRIPGEVWAWTIGLVIALAWWLRPRVRPRPAAIDAKRAWPARTMLIQILRNLAQKGLSRGAAETLEQYQRTLAHFLGRRGDQLDPRLVRAFSAYQDVRFGARPWDAAREAELQAGIEAARDMARYDAAEPASGR